MNIPFADKATISNNLPFNLLIKALQAAFANPSIVTPKRHHHDFENPKEGKQSTLLLMPAWNPGEELGVKIVTVSPNNGKYNLPAIQGIYLLFDGHKGIPELLLDAKELTVKRTAATSALASSYLSREDSHTLFMVGTGALSTNLIRAHATVRPINKVLVWGRDEEKAKKICDEVSGEFTQVETVNEISTGIKNSDIISCATLSPMPLILGKFIKLGQHIDLVGAYKPDMREADDEVIIKSDIFIDSEAAKKETGDLAVPLASGLLDEQKIVADLFQLCSGVKNGRKNNDQITLFKSVGHAMEDLVAAKMVKDQLGITKL